MTGRAEQTGDRVTEIWGRRIVRDSQDADDVKYLLAELAQCQADRDEAQMEYADALAELDSTRAVVDELRRQRGEVLAELEGARAKLANVEALHRRVPVYATEIGDCEHGADCEGIELSNGQLMCPHIIEGYTCAECSELSRDNPDGWWPEYPCETVAALHPNQEGEGDD